MESVSFPWSPGVGSIAGHPFGAIQVAGGQSSVPNSGSLALGELTKRESVE